MSHLICVLAYGCLKSIMRENPKGDSMSLSATKKVPPSPCPYCGVLVSLARLDEHKTLRCPMAPPDVIKARPPRPKRRERHINIAEGQYHQPVDTSQSDLKLAYARYVRDQRDSMSD